jgi:hypothetical protein
MEAAAKPAPAVVRNVLRERFGMVFLLNAILTQSFRKGLCFFDMGSLFMGISVGACIIPRLLVRSWQINRVDNSQPSRVFFPRHLICALSSPSHSSTKNDVQS